jgi:phytoene dehydrogenase-like protein
MRLPVLIIGGGLSGLAAAVRISRFGQRVLLVEQHTRPGGLNSWFFRNKTLFETGLHAITNFAEPGNKHAPLNRLLRQLKVKRSEIEFCPQLGSKILFENCATLHFSNDFNLFETEVSEKFPGAVDNVRNLLTFLQQFDAFAPAPFRSARAFLDEIFAEPLLTEMLLCPLMYYGSSNENDMDLAQFAIMFRAIFLEGMFRPKGSIKDFIDLLLRHIEENGGEIRTGCGVRNIVQHKGYATALLENGEEIECDYILSTIGSQETEALLQRNHDPTENTPRLSFVENIFQLPYEELPAGAEDTAIIFFNRGEKFHYQRPQSSIDPRSGVICFPSGFKGVARRELVEIRTTHLAATEKWERLAMVPEAYQQEKKRCSELSCSTAESLIGDFAHAVTFRDMFTPLTIKRYTGKIDGAIYGHPNKIKDGNIGLSNIFLAGTDQGFLGIVGSMLSGVSIVNQHILPRL